MKISNHQKLLIRLATPRDSQPIVQLQYDSLRFLAADDYTPRQLEALLASKSCPRVWDETIFIAEINRKIVGFASISNYINIVNAVFVKPNFARCGIGTQLLLTIEQEAVKNNLKELKVCSSLTGHAFYLANGYKTLGKTAISVDSISIPCINMKKRLLFKTKIEHFLELCSQILLVILALIWLFCLFF